MPLFNRSMSWNLGWVNMDAVGTEQEEEGTSKEQMLLKEFTKLTEL